MKKTYLFSILMGFSSILFGQPCTPSSSAGCSLDYISFFSLKGESGSAIYSSSLCSPGAYADYTSLFTPVDLAKQNTYSGFIQTSSSDDYLTLWIDSDNDLVFEDEERLIHHLKCGPNKLLYGLYIPNSMILGQHRMRLRISYFSSVPAYATLTDPCNLITWSETEDYLVNITNLSGSSSVGGGEPGNCQLLSTHSIGPNSNNASATNISILDSNNNRYAGLYPLGNTLGTVNSSIFVHNGPVRQDFSGKYYMDRNLTIESSIPPVTSYSMRYYYKNSELNALIAQPGSGVTSQFDLTMTKNGQQCLSAVYNQPTGQAIFPTGFGAYIGDRFIDCTNLNGFSSFFLHGGSTPIGYPAAALSDFQLNIQARKQEEDVRLNWDYIQPDIVSFFVQRSVDGVNFSDIAQVYSESGKLNYHLLDKQVPKGMLYYRLIMGTQDGKQYYSSIVTLRMTEDINEFYLQSNLIQNNLELELFQSTHMKMMNVSGQVLWSMSLNKGRHSVSIAELPSGMYYLSSGIQTIKVIKL